MAKVLPHGWEALEVTGAAQREIETLRLLASALPESYTIYHSVHWTLLEHGSGIHGEIDFVVVNRAGDLLLIEQKCGFLSEGPEGLVKRYGERMKSVSAQVSRTLHAMQKKLFQSLGGDLVRIEHLFYCPDYQVRNPVTAGLQPERIVDATRRGALANVIQRILPEGEPADVAKKVHRFLSDTLQLATDVSTRIGQARALVTRVAGGLAHWGRRLRFAPYRLRVTGTAGSGKTQLALAELQNAIAADQRVLYLCFNRPLADHMTAIAPPGSLCSTFHAFCDSQLQHAGIRTDFSQPGAFAQLIEHAAALTPTEKFIFDLIIVDEGQDFEPGWRPLIFRHAAENARLIWLEDPMQNLYARPAFNEPGWVQIDARTNYRCPRPVVRMLQGLLPEGDAIEAASPFDEALDFITYTDAEGLRNGVKEAIRQCLSAGFRKQDIVILSSHGQQTSALMPHDQLGPHHLRRFTGHYDMLGGPIYSEGELLLESVYRFKGQSAPAVVLAEIDFEQLDEREARKLFVGASRAMMKLVIVLSERSAALLTERM